MPVEEPILRRFGRNSANWGSFSGTTVEPEVGSKAPGSNLVNRTGFHVNRLLLPGSLPPFRPALPCLVGDAVVASSGDP